MTCAPLYLLDHDLALMWDPVQSRFCINIRTAQTKFMVILWLMVAMVEPEEMEGSICIIQGGVHEADRERIYK